MVPQIRSMNTRKFEPLQDQYSQSHQLQRVQMPYSSKLPAHYETKPYKSHNSDAIDG